ncbi:hypothetical protein ACQ4PT_063048 [Festuca glaucescens]
MRREEAAAMAGQMSKEEVGTVLMQAMLAAKNLRPQRDRLLQLRRRLQQLTPGDDDKAAVQELASNLFKVYYIGIEAGARSIATCLELAAQNGARLALNPALAVIPDEHLYDALLTQRLPARPTTQTEAFTRVEATFYTVKLSQEHHLPRCIEHLVGDRPPLVTDEFSDDGSEDEDEDEEDPVAAVTEGLAKTGLSDPAPAATGEPPQAAASSSLDLDKARTYLDRACTLVSLAVKHIDLAVVVLSRFVDPEEVASLSDFTDKFAYISEQQKATTLAYIFNKLSRRERSNSAAAGTRETEAPASVTAEKKVPGVPLVSLDVAADSLLENLFTGVSAVKAAYTKLQRTQFLSDAEEARDWRRKLEAELRAKVVFVWAGAPRLQLPRLQLLESAVAASWS